LYLLDKEKKMNNITQYLEHTNLNPLILADDVEQAVAETITHGFVGLCVPPYWAKKAKRDLGKSPAALVTVIGFPFGYQRSEVKVQEVKSAIRDKVDEFDVVVNLSAIKNKAYHWIKIEMAQLAQIIHEQEGILKAIIETAYLDEKEMIQTCKACAEAGVDFIKTSTGYAPKGAEVDKVRFLRSILPPTVGIKASGGIKTLAQALAFIEAGAERIGTSAGISIVNEQKNIASKQ
jgi:deoxyribose-phosphate aldolase